MKTWQRRQDFNLRVFGSEPNALSAWLRRCITCTYFRLAGALGLEPRLGGTKIHCIAYYATPLQTWVEVRESNPSLRFHGPLPKPLGQPQHETITLACRLGPGYGRIAGFTSTCR